MRVSAGAATIGAIERRAAAPLPEAWAVRPACESASQASADPPGQRAGNRFVTFALRLRRRRRLPSAATTASASRPRRHQKHEARRHEPTALVGVRWSPPLAPGQTRSAERREARDGASRTRRAGPAAPQSGSPRGEDCEKSGVSTVAARVPVVRPANGRCGRRLHRTHSRSALPATARACVFG